MVAPFKRYFGVGARVSSSVPPGAFLVDNTSGEGLRIDWDVRLTNTHVPDQAEIMIYNLGPKLRLAVDELYATTVFDFGVSLEIGWDGVLMSLFSGEVWDCIPDRHTKTDVITTLMCGDGLQNYRDAAAASNIQAAGLAFAIQSQITAPPPNGLGLKIESASLALIQAQAAALPVQTWANLDLTGNTRENVSSLMDTIGLSWAVRHGYVIAFLGGVVAAPESPLLSPVTGLLEWEPMPGQGIRLRALARPDVTPGVQIIVQDAFGKPVGSPAFRVETVRFTGTTRGTSVMDVTGRRPAILAA